MEYVLLCTYPPEKVPHIMKDCLKFGLTEDKILEHTYDDRIVPYIESLIMKLSVLRSKIEDYKLRAHENLPIKVEMNLPKFEATVQSHSFFYERYSKKRNNRLIKLTFFNIKKLIVYLLTKINNKKKLLFVFHILENFYLKSLQLQQTNTIRKSEFMSVYDVHFNYFVNDVLQYYGCNVYEKFRDIIDDIKTIIHKLAVCEKLSVKNF